MLLTTPPQVEPEVLGPNGGMLMVTASGTAVKLNY